MQILYNFQRLKNYAEWYYFRYFPSDKKLLQKLQQKGSEEDAQKVFSDMKHLLVEDRTLESLIENYIFRHKNFRYITQKMREKGFPTEKVENYLMQYKESWESLLWESYLLKKVENLLQKGKSQQYIFQKLTETPEDKLLLENIFETHFQDGETQALQKEWEKILRRLWKNHGDRLSSQEKQKIIQKLMMKWFSYDAIKKMIKNLQ